MKSKFLKENGLKRHKTLTLQVTVIPTSTICNATCQQAAVQLVAVQLLLVLAKHFESTDDALTDGDSHDGTGLLVMAIVCNGCGGDAYIRYTGTSTRLAKTCKLQQI